jgi:ectoine hydroxylase-related dioxygenase (phytanoyl-CoA dioxygenase family)
MGGESVRNTFALICLTPSFPNYMKHCLIHRKEIEQFGYTVIPDVYDDIEIDGLIQQIEGTKSDKSTFRRTEDLFAIRQFLKEVPAVIPIIFNEKLKAIIAEIFAATHFVVKSIYFDKPESSNWFVAYHQDLTISVKERHEVPGFGPWTVKQNQFAVQPPVELLQQNFTIRIHLNETDKSNGALRVIPGSHQKGIYRPENIDWSEELEQICDVPKGGIMIMRPLLLHSSSRSTGNRRRRVVHIEFAKSELPQPLEWSEQL